VRVFINTIPLYGRSPGLRTYTAGLLTALSASDADMEWRVILRPQDAERLRLSSDARFQLAPFSFLAHGSQVPGVRFIWRNMVDQTLALWLARRHDVVHYVDSYGPVRPARRTPVAITVHDILPLLERRYFSPWVARYLGSLMQISIPKASAVMAVSGHTARLLSARLHIPPERIVVIPAGVDERFRPSSPAALQAIATRYRLTVPYIIYVGSINPRKNVDRLIRAFAHARRAHDLPHQLLLVGEFGWQYDHVLAAIRKAALGDTIRVLGHVPAEDVPALISGAVCLAYPSLEEGFGLPVIEAMACGTPVLTSAASSLKEVARNAALLVDPTSEDAIAQALIRLIHDQALRDSLHAAGLARARDFEWKQVAAATIQVYRQVAAMSAC
jgi:glycosyltransferase involved in cell wall biosynthesis